MERAVVAAQPCQGIVDVPKQAIGLQGRQGAEHAAAGDIAAGLKTGRSPVEQTKGRQGALVGPGAGRAHLGRGIKDGPGGLVGGRGRLWNGNVFRRGLLRLERTGLDQSSLLDSLAQGIAVEAQSLGDFVSGSDRLRATVALGP